MAKQRLTFLEAARKLGYMQKGKFKALPKKGTKEYLKIRAKMGTSAPKS